MTPWPGDMEHLGSHQTHFQPIRGQHLRQVTNQRAGNRQVAHWSWGQVGCNVGVSHQRPAVIKIKMGRSGDWDQGCLEPNSLHHRSHVTRYNNRHKKRNVPFVSRDVVKVEHVIFSDIVIIAFDLHPPYAKSDMTNLRTPTLLHSCSNSDIFTYYLSLRYRPHCTALVARGWMEDREGKTRLGLGRLVHPDQHVLDCHKEGER